MTGWVPPVSGGKCLLGWPWGALGAIVAMGDAAALASWC